ncbi:hypothetical protein [Solidesulfovibrio sp.]
MPDDNDRTLQTVTRFALVAGALFLLLMIAKAAQAPGPGRTAETACRYGMCEVER